MKSDHQDNSSEPASSEVDSPSNPPPRKRPKNIRPPLPEDYKELCVLCRAGKLFAVQDWFKTHRYDEPERVTSAHWPMGIAIERGFHSLVEVLLQNGIPADGGALQRAVQHHNVEIVELLLDHGATVDMVNFDYVVFSGNRDIIVKFIQRGADLVTGYPFATGLIRQTRSFLGIYKANIQQHPELQFQADMALRHFCQEGSLRGVSLMMWLGANPRAKVPLKDEESEDWWETPLATAAMYGKIDVIKRLKPDPKRDDLHDLLQCGIFRLDTGLVRYWLSLGADKNHAEAEGRTLHHQVISKLSWSLDPRNNWISGSDGWTAKRFATEWFSAGVKWNPQRDEFTEIRKALSLLSYLEAYEFIKLLLAQQVMPAEILGEILDTPKLREHLKERRVAIAAVVPRMQKWVKAEERKRQREQKRTTTGRQSSSRRVFEAPLIRDDPRNVRKLSDE